MSKLKRNGYLKGILVVALGDSSHFLSLNPHNFSMKKETIAAIIIILQWGNQGTEFLGNWSKAGHTS